MLLNGKVQNFRDHVSLISVFPLFFLMKNTIQRWLARGIRTPRTAAYRGISLEEFFQDIEAGGFMGMVFSLEPKTCIPVYLSPLNLTTQAATLPSGATKRLLQRILDDRAINLKDFGDNEQEINHARQSALFHALAAYFNNQGFYPMKVVCDLVHGLPSVLDVPPTNYYALAKECNISQDSATTIWQTAIQRKGLVLAFHEGILEKRIESCCYPNCLKIFLPQGETLPFSYVEGIEIPNPIEREELLASC